MSTYYGLIMPMIYAGGTYIQSISQTKTSDESGGLNEITVTLTNRTQEKFYVKNGVSAGFDEPTASATTLEPEQQATAEVESSGENTAKKFCFTFGIPKGEKGSGYALKVEKGAHFGEAGTPSLLQEDRYDESTDTTESTVTFDYMKGDTGEAAGFAEPSATIETIGPHEKATVEIEATGTDTAKKFSFAFKIPKGETGIPGATTETTGIFGFYIDNNTGDFMLSYSGEEAPALSLNDNGELIYTYQEKE